MSLKLIAIASSLLLFGCLERYRPFFRSKAGRWTSHLANLELAAVNILAVRYSTALLFERLWPQSADIGLFHGQQGWEIFALSLLVLDLYMYLWHRLMHSTAWGWRLHCVHHSDRHLTVTTAYRFHTLEVLLSQLSEIALICLLGVPPFYLLVYESLYAAELLFHHSNWALPQPWDRWLSYLIVTPHYHRSHHSQNERHQNANYASFLTLWDSLFQSRRYPRRPEQIQLGLDGAVEMDAMRPGKVSRFLSCWTLLWLPFKTPVNSGYRGL